MSGRNIQHVTRFEPTEIGDGHALVTIEAVGVTINGAGEISTNRMWGHLDHVDGAGPDRGYFERTWPDGSTTVERFDGETRVDENGAVTFDGTFEYVRGTGRFTGATGQGTYEGKAYDNGMLVVDWQATMDLESE